MFSPRAPALIDNMDILRLEYTDRMAKRRKPGTGTEGLRAPTLNRPSPRATARGSGNEAVRL